MGGGDDRAKRSWNARDWALLATSTALAACVGYLALRTYHGFQEYKVAAAQQQLQWDRHEYLHSHRQPYSNRTRTNPHVLSTYG